MDTALSIPDSVQLRWLTLTFPEELEKAFRESYFENSLLQVRITFLLGVFFYSVFGILDQWMVPDAKYMLWFIRYGIFAPYALSLYLFSFTRHFKRYMQPSIAFGVLLAGLGIAAMVLIAPYPASYSYYAGLLLVFIYGYTFVRLRFWWATTTGWLIVVAYEVAAVWLTSTPIPVLVNNNFFFLAANILCMFVCYAIEYYSRRDFIQARMLKVEKKKVDDVNRELESRVQERTAQLETINQELKQEIVERRRTEKERHYLEAQLRKSQKMEAIGTLAGGVAHDLNNILSGLVSYPELLLMGLPEDSPIRQPLLTIKESGDKAAAIVQDLLTLARRGVSVREIVNLNQVVEQYLHSHEHRQIFDAHDGIQMETRLAPDLLSVVGSPVHLSKTLMNLVANALEAMPGGGRLCICTENRYIDKYFKGFDAVEEGDFAVLTVSDTGVGISPEDLERIFEPFYTKKSMGRSGTGLGMAVVWGTVKDHDGYIDIDSKLGQGTTFSLYFPITREMPADEQIQIPLERYRGHGESILVVDDVKEQREIASEMLRKMGYSVVSVPSGEEAVGYLKENKADLLVLDMIMNPGMDGLDTYREILQYHPHQKAIIASGYSESDRVKQAQGMGAGAYVKKPYSFEKIGLAVKAELGKTATLPSDSGNTLQPNPPSL